MTSPRSVPAFMAFVAAFLCLFHTASAPAAPAAAPMPGVARPGDEVWRRQLSAETDRLAARGLAEIRSLDDWQVRRSEWRRELSDMLGLWPWPARTDLKAAVTGRT